MTSFPRMLSSWGEFDLVSDLSTFKVVSTLSDLHLQLFRLPGVQSEGPDLGQVDAQTPAGSGRPFKPAPSPPRHAGAHLWMPEHSMHSVIPRLMEAQRGSASPQSQHTWFPEPLRATPRAAGASPWAEPALPETGGSLLTCRQTGRVAVETCLCGR